MQEAWFVAITMLFTGYFVLEGFDFGVGMLLPALGEGVDARRRVLINTIGPVWDGNEVWLITAIGAMFAAFPEWYASLLSGFYPLILLILVSLILRVCAIEYRGKIDDPVWRARCDRGIGIGSWIPAFGWGVVFANIVHGVPLDAHKQVTSGPLGLFSAYTLLGGLATALLFALHGAVFLGVKTADDVRADAVKLAAVLAGPTLVVLGAFAVWTQIDAGKGWTWWVVLALVVSLVATAALARVGRDGWAFVATMLAVTATMTLLFGSLFPNVLPSTLDPAFDLTIHNASSTPYTLHILTWLSAFVLPVVLAYQGWTYWVFRRRLSARDIPPAAGLPAGSG